VVDVGWPLAAIFASAGAAFFFSLHKLAIQMFSKVKLAEAYKQANLENITDKVSENQEKLVLVCSFLWRIANLCIFISLLWFITHTGQRITGIDFVLLFVTAGFITIFNLVVPFAWAKYSGEKILVRTYKLITFFAMLAKPVEPIFRLNDLIVRRLSGYTESTPEEAHDEKQEEFLSVVEESMMDGVVDQQEQRMIEQVLELGETTVEEIMTPRTDVIAIDITCDFKTLIETINKAGHSRIPVYEENIDQIIGLVYAKDLLQLFGTDLKDFNLRNYLRKAYFVPETKRLSVLLNEFKAQKLHIAIVLDEYGGTAGIITIEDILEEVVGEIEDEYETPAPKNINIIDENTVDVDARTYIDDLNHEFDINIPEDDDYDTIGGFVFSYLGYIPKNGAEFTYDSLKFTITQAEERSVKRLKIQKLIKKQTASEQ
jgi:CBS domain containing-hemolysin-like protein